MCLCWWSSFRTRSGTTPSPHPISAHEVLNHTVSMHFPMTQFSHELWQTSYLERKLLTSNKWTQNSYSICWTAKGSKMSSQLPMYLSLLHLLTNFVGCGLLSTFPGAPSSQSPTTPILSGLCFLTLPGNCKPNLVRSHSNSYFPPAETQASWICLLFLLVSQHYLFSLPRPQVRAGWLYY